MSDVNDLLNFEPFGAEKFLALRLRCEEETPDVRVAMEEAFGVDRSALHAEAHGDLRKAAAKVLTHAMVRHALLGNGVSSEDFARDVGDFIDKDEAFILLASYGTWRSM